MIDRNLELQVYKPTNTLKKKKKRVERTHVINSLPKSKSTPKKINSSKRGNIIAKNPKQI